MKLRYFSTLFSLLSCVVFSVPAVAAEDGINWPKRLVVSVPTSGNVVHMTVSAMAKTIEDHTPIERVIVQPIGGPASWLPRMEKGQVDMAVHNTPDTMELIQGLGDGEKLGAKPFLRTVITGGIQMCGVITIPGKGIEKYSDLKDKVVVLRNPGNPLWERIANIVLASAGLTQKDLKSSLTMINYREVTSDILEGRTDALINPGSGPFMMELAQSAGKNVVVEPSDSEAEYLKQHLPRGFYIDSLPANTPYFNNSDPIGKAILYRNAIYARADMDPEVAYAIIKAIDENRNEWEDISPSCVDWGKATDLMPPYHEGVVRYYKEKGLWTDAMQAQYDKMLTLVKADK